MAGDGVVVIVLIVDVGVDSMFEAADIGWTAKNASMGEICDR